MIGNNYGSEFNLSLESQGGAEKEGYEKLHDLLNISTTVKVYLKKGEYTDLVEHLRDNYAKEGIRAKYENSGYSSKDQFLEEINNYPDLERKLDEILRDMLEAAEETEKTKGKEREWTDKLETLNEKFESLLLNK